jgi:hypothetical protein
MDNNDKEQLRDSFPSNSKIGKREIQVNKSEPRKLDKVITGSVRKQKRPLSKKFAEVFLEDDTKSVGNYIFHDVLIPAAKALISDVIGGGVEMLLFGERRGRASSSLYRDGNRTRVNYGSSYRSLDRDPRDRGRDISRVSRVRHDFDEIVFETRGEAEEVLSRLVDLTRDYNQATVADLYQLVGITENFTDNNYGWTNLSSSSVSRVRDGYVINLPQPQALD